jgi:hypothetical protein
LILLGDKNKYSKTKIILENKSHKIEMKIQTVNQSKIKMAENMQTSSSNGNNKCTIGHPANIF